MPYVQGETLRDLLAREHRLSLDQATRITGEVASALDYAHAEGVIHRDIKPANILLSAGHAIVADFGIARAVSDADSGELTHTGMSVGTPAYMSPEQASGDSVDGRTDVYSLGCVLYEMLAGRPPFLGPSLQALVAQHLVDPPPSLRQSRADIPKHVYRVVETALAKEPEARFATAGDLAQQLANPDYPDRYILWRLRRWWSRMVRSLARHRLRVATVAALAVVAALAEVATHRHHPSAGIALVLLPLQPASGTDTVSRGSESLFAQAIEWIPGLRVIDGSRLGARAANWRALPTVQLRDAVSRIGGEYWIAGEIRNVSGTTGSRVSIEVYSTRDGSRVAQGDEPSRGTDLGDPFSRLALQLARVLVSRGALRLPTRTTSLGATTSSIAFGRLLQGQSRFWSGDLDGAAQSFRAAIQTDSNCGLAYHRLGVSLAWAHDYPAALTVLKAGLARPAAAPSPWLGLLRAQRYYVLGAGDSAVAAFQDVVLDHADQADAWLGLGEAFFHFSGLNGHTAAEALPAFEHLITLDSSFAPIYEHLFDLSLFRGDVAGAVRSLRYIRGDDPARPARDAALALWGSSRTERELELKRLERADRYTISELMSILMPARRNLPLADTIAAFLVNDERTPDDRRRGAEYRLGALAGDGRWNEGLEQWRRNAGSPSLDPWLVESYFAGYAVKKDVAPMFRWAEAELRAGHIPNFSLTPADDPQLAFLALVARATLEGDSSEAVGLLRAIARSATQTPPSDPLPGTLRASLASRLALLAHDTAQAIVHLEIAVGRYAEAYLPFSPLVGFAPQRLLLSRLYGKRGQLERRQRWLNSFQNSRALSDVFYDARLGQRSTVPRGPSSFRRST
jgi:hypothetical protein